MGFISGAAILSHSKSRPLLEEYLGGDFASGEEKSLEVQNVLKTNRTYWRTGMTAKKYGGLQKKVNQNSLGFLLK